MRLPLPLPSSLPSSPAPHAFPRLPARRRVGRHAGTAGARRTRLTAAARLLRGLCAGSLALLLVRTGVANAQDPDFLGARDAYQKGNVARLDGFEPALRGTPLEPYVTGWQLRLRFDRWPEADVQSYLERWAGQYPAHRLRVDWMKFAGRNARWDLFDREWPRVPEPDTELACLRWQSRLAQGDRAALADAKPAWFATREQPEACQPVFDALFASGVATDADRWQRVRLALDADNASLAIALTAKLPAGVRLERKAVDAIGRDPQRALDPRRVATATRAQRELALYALGRAAAAQPLAAADAWQRVVTRFPPEDRAWGWALVASPASRRHLPEALSLWARTEGATLTSTQKLWRARAAVRATDWAALDAAIDALPADERDSPAWRYWKARSAAAQGRKADADALYVAVAQDTGFHGLLALEELGPTLSVPTTPWRPTDADVTAAAALPGVARALALYRTGLRYEGNLEWNWSMRELDDRALLAAAELARREGWYERTVSSADRTRQLVIPELRYPMPYRDLLVAGSRANSLDEAWVFGLVRQESRFMANARSSVGASGLMQVMPATARWIARKLGTTEWRGAVDGSLADNVTFGTFYLRTALDRHDGSPVLATAAYNAGPSRAWQWRPADAPIEGAVFVDTIPFAETRDYVRKVMANATHYARLLGRSADRLKLRIGTIPPRSASTPPPADLPSEGADGGPVGGIAAPPASPGGTATTP